MSAATMEPSDNLTRSPATSVAAGIVVHTPVPLHGCDEREPRFESVERGLRPALLEEADRRICDQKERDDAGFHVIAEK